MTATRTVRFWVIAAAVVLWRTSVPSGLDVPQIDTREVFGDRQIERSGRYERGLRLLWAGALLAQLAVLGLAVWLAPRARLRGILGGVALGAGTLVAVWIARLPFVLTAHWWRRRY